MAGQQEHRFVLGASAYNESLSNKTTVTDDVTADVTAAAGRLYCAIFLDNEIMKLAFNHENSAFNPQK